jgi:hypothetical protein
VTGECATGRESAHAAPDRAASQLMIESRRRSDHMAIEHAFNRVVATVQPFPGILRC